MNKLIANTILTATFAAGSLPAFSEPHIPVHRQSADDYGNIKDYIEYVRLVDVGSIKQHKQKTYANYRIDCNNRYDQNLGKTYQWLEADCQRNRLRTGRVGKNNPYWLVRKANGEWHEEGSNHRYAHLVDVPKQNLLIYDEWDSSLFDFVCGS